MPQALLFPDPKPLDQRLGRNFFCKAPSRPGVYLMKDEGGRVIYVGKAKDLKQRLNNYRLANPDRMPRRHLRMVREVARIDFQFCGSEAAALRRESRLLRSLRPKFNRAGVWPGRPRFIVWRALEANLEVGVVEVPEPGWHRYGPMNSSARVLHQALSRLLWLAVRAQATAAELPAGWGNGRLADRISIPCGSEIEGLLSALGAYFWEDPAVFVQWLESRLEARTHAFERAVIAADLEPLQNFAGKRGGKISAFNQLALL
jgi:hypothetical protein